MTPWPETEVVVTGLKGGVGALLARDALLRGAKKVCVIDDNSWCLRHDKSTDEFYGELTGVG